MYIERTDESSERIALDETELLCTPPPSTTQKDLLKPFDSTPFITYVCIFYIRLNLPAPLPRL